MPPKIILASGSPRRRELLEKLGVPFQVVTADVEEVTPRQTLEPEKVAIDNAVLKASAVSRLHPDQTVLGADTIVVLGDRVFGKPPTLQDARDFLAELSGETHDVITGCCLVTPGRVFTTFAETSRVTFRALSPDIIANYLNAVHVLDKAGAYALQEHGDWLVERIEGSRDNILGLPTEVLPGVLKHCGLF